MAKLSLKANPTFAAKVPIPVAGSDPVEVGFTFKHMNREDFAAWMKSLDGKEKATAVLDMAGGWELDDPFTEESVKQLLSEYMGAFPAIFDKYAAELTQAKRGN